MVVTRSNAVHALLYLITSLISVALMFFVLGAPFVAALQVMIYAAAIMVLLAFAIMLSGSGIETQNDPGLFRRPMIWAGPVALAGVLLCGLIYAVTSGGHTSLDGAAVTPEQVSGALFSPYLLGLELISLLLLGALVGACRVGTGDKNAEPGGTEKG